MEHLIIILLNFIVYSRTLRYGLVVDDINRHKPLGIWQKWFVERALKKGKIIAELLAYWNSLHGSVCWKLNQKVERLINIFIHTLCCIMVYEAFGRTQVSFWASILFAVHPANNQVAIWLNGKRYGINTLLVLLMWWLKPWGILLYVFTPYWQVNAILSPLLYLTAGYWWTVFALIPLGLFCAFYKNLVRGKFMFRIREIPKSDLKVIHPRKLILFFKTLCYYFVHCLLPIKMSFFHTWLEEYELSPERTRRVYRLDAWFWAGVVLFPSLVFLIYAFWSTPLSWGLLWWLLFTIQWCHFPITVCQSFADRYCYLPLAGLMYALSWTMFEVGKWLGQLL